MKKRDKNNFKTQIQKKKLSLFYVQIFIVT